jgi:hypothetical protein
MERKCDVNISIPRKMELAVKSNLETEDFKQLALSPLYCMI